jgi:threonine synthase
VHYVYRCFQCRREWPAQEIEPDHYLCPQCGKCEPRRPLEGALTVEYDYVALRNSPLPARLRSARIGRIDDYPELWPLLPAVSRSGQFASCHRALLDECALPPNLVSEWQIDGATVQVLDETRNPTASFKDRASLLVVLKALQLGIREISASSTGNAGTSLAGICARTGITSHIWVPAAIPRGKLLQLAAYGAHVYLVDGDYDAAFDIGLEVSHARRWYSRNTAYNPLTIEGKKSAAYDIFLACTKLPDFVFIPTGDGVILAGIHKGFRELRDLGLIERLPRLVAVQAEHSDALCRYLSSGTFEYAPAHTVADSISAGAPRNLYMAAHALHDSAGFVVAVSDDAILAAQQCAGRERGILIEPAAAASLAGYLQLREQGTIASRDSAMLLFTGHGLKDPASLERSLPQLTPRSVAQWRTEFGLESSGV